MTTSKLPAAMVAGLCIGLISCGGGGDDSVPNPPPGGAFTTAEGVYGGVLTNSSSSYFEGLVLENGDFWSLYGDDAGSIFIVQGFVQGRGTSNNGAFTAATITDYGFSPPLTGTLSATYNSASKTMSGTANYGPMGSVTFNGGPIAGSLYNYNASATLSAISGNWSVQSTAGGSASVTISGAGAVTATEGACVSTGSIMPRVSGKNVFNVTLTFGASGCALPGATVTGIAITYPLSTGQTQLIAAITTGSKSAGLAYFGIR
jgi:hypothetical protein